MFWESSTLVARQSTLNTHLDRGRVLWREQLKIVRISISVNFQIIFNELTRHFLQIVIEKYFPLWTKLTL